MNAATVYELKQHVEGNKLDPHDPDNHQIIKLLKDHSVSKSGSSTAKAAADDFRLEPPDLELMSEQEFESDRRFKLLELRSQGVPEFKNMKMIPSNSREIPVDIFKAYNQRLQKDKEKTEISDIEAYRSGVSKYLAQIRERVIRKLNQAKQAKSLQDIVHEDPLPSFGKLSFLIFADPGRPLKPPRAERKKVGGQKVTGLKVKLIANIIRAFNLPTRHGGLTEEMSKPENYIGPPALEPFVEVAFQNQVIRTSTLQGSNPTWNQQLFLDFKAPNDDYTPANLQTIMDSIYFNVYDRILSDLPEDDRIKEDTVHQQIEKRWLGTLQIPFSSLYFNGRIYGSFRLRVPPVLLGYSIEDLQDDLTRPHLQIFLAIDPPLTIPDPIRGKLDTVESEKLIAYSQEWHEKLEEAFPTRRFVSLVTDMNGRAVHMSRFLRDIKPPELIVQTFEEDPMKGLILACRIASLVPFVTDSALFPGLCDIWGTCEQFLSMLCGDEEEHAVLFACWAAGLELDPYLVLGNGIPEGPRAAYVMVQPTRKAGDYVFFNCTSGEHFLQKDPLCPLSSVGVIANPDNVYANTQETEHPSTMSFDVLNVKHWRPFFSKAFPNPTLTSVQPESLTYTEPNVEAVHQLQERVERAIRDRFMSWRPHAITRFNRYAVQILRQLTASLEADIRTGDHQKQHKQALQPITSTYYMCGFPLNLGYTSTDAIAEAVKATNLHQNHHKDVEFAIVVHIHPYPNEILSVWVYVASLVRKKETT